LFTARGAQLAKITNDEVKCCFIRKAIARKPKPGLVVVSM